MMKHEKQLKKGILLIGFCNMLAGFILMVWTFWDAFLTPNKRIIVYINRYGEANIEAYILLFLTPFTVVTIVYFFQLIVKENDCS